MFILARAAAEGNGGGGGSSLLVNLLPVVAIVAIMYFLLIRPQRTKEKRRREMLRSLEKNDRVVTIGGIHGVVKNVTDNDVMVLVDEKINLTLKFNRSAVYSILNRDEQGELPGEEKK